MKISESELILNPDGSIYHLNILPEDIANTIFLVGDPDRVPQVSQYFDSIELKKQKREFITHTGYVGKKRVSVISTGISTDNIDIVLNELDALVNIDFNSRTIKNQLTSLDIIRIGTAGGLQKDIPLDAPVVSTFGIGLDGLGNFYSLQHSANEAHLKESFQRHFGNNPILYNAYVCSSAQQLTSALQPECHAGITVTCCGFYGPQGRILRAQPAVHDFVAKLNNFSWQEEFITNIEMETAGIFAMCNLLGHRGCSVSAIVANRITQEFSRTPYETVDKTIRLVLDKICS